MPRHEVQHVVNHVAEPLLLPADHLELVPRAHLLRALYEEVRDGRHAPVPVAPHHGVARARVRGEEAPHDVQRRRRRERRLAVQRPAQRGDDGGDERADDAPVRLDHLLASRERDEPHGFRRLLRALDEDGKPLSNVEILLEGRAVDLPPQAILAAHERPAVLVRRELR